MREKLLALAALQRVDVEVAALRKNADAYPKEIGELERQLAGAKSAVDAERARLDDLEKQRLTLEQTVTEEKDKVKKWEARLTEQRSTREYSALAREIDIAKKGQVTMGEEITELGRQATIQREAVRQKDAAFVEGSKGLLEKIAQLKSRLEEAEAAVRALDGSREAAAKGVDGALMKRYDVVRKKRMPAMVALAPPGRCTGCGMSVPAMMYTTLVTTKGTDTCPACSRIVYAQEVLDEPKAK